VPRLAVSVAVLLAAWPVWPQSPGKPLSVEIRMRDGVGLSANVFLPPGARRVSTVLVRTPYGKGAGLSSTYLPFLRAGYGVVIQDVRGRGQSGGAFNPLHQEVNDGRDTLDWIAAQTWSDARIVAVGGSYLGIAQWQEAISGSPYLKAISRRCPAATSTRTASTPGRGAEAGHRLPGLPRTCARPAS
jgi:putative CocE/NonD family hydrolase